MKQTSLSGFFSSPKQKKKLKAEQKQNGRKKKKEEAAAKRSRTATPSGEEDGVQLFEEEEGQQAPRGDEVQPLMKKQKNSSGKQKEEAHDDDDAEFMDEGEDDDSNAAGSEQHSPADEDEELSDISVEGAVSKISESFQKHAANKYHPIDDAGWKRGKAVPYKALADTFDSISQESSRTLKICMLCNLFRSILVLTPEDLLMTLYLCTNKLGPVYEGIELGIGESIIMKSIGETCGKTLAVLKEALARLGDLGLVAMESRKTQKTLFPPPPLTIRGVFKNFRRIALLKGARSGAEKRSIIGKMLVSARDAETIFITRSLQGKLRIGVSDKSVLHALTYAIVVTPPDAKFPPRIINRFAEGNVRRGKLQALLEKSLATVKAVYMEVPSYETILPHLLAKPDKEGGIRYGKNISLLRSKCRITPGVPVHPMLAQPTKGITEVLDRLASAGFTCEYKYDGERAQVHMTSPGKLKVYSRNLEDNSEKYPDIIRDVPHAIVENEEQPATTSFILDCEAVAWDVKQQKRRPFQILSTRRKKNVTVESIEVRVMLYAFDILFLNGESLLQTNLEQRRKILRSVFRAVPNEFAFAEYRDCSTVEEVRQFLELSVREECEGLMVKTLREQATYEPSLRSYNWLKVKKDYLEGMTDSLDLVPIGAWLGRGKRTGVYGGYLLACYDEDEEEYQTCCVVGTGFSDVQLKEFYEALKDTVLDKKPHYYKVGEGKQANPDVWLSPTQVWEIRAADLSISPVHQAGIGLVKDNKGIALRFPRILRVREDKGPEQATSSQQVADMYNAQFNQSSALGYGLDNENMQSLKQYRKETSKR